MKHVSNVFKVFEMTHQSFARWQYWLFGVWWAHKQIWKQLILCICPKCIGTGASPLHPYHCFCPKPDSLQIHKYKYKCRNTHAQYKCTYILFAHWHKPLLLHPYHCFCPKPDPVQSVKASWKPLSFCFKCVFAVLYFLPITILSNYTSCWNWKSSKLLCNRVM